MDTDRAPTFSRGSDYPMGGTRLGPAWQRIWTALQDREWKTTSFLVSGPGNPLSENAVRNLLVKGHRAGKLERRETRIGSRVHAEYRRKP